MATYVNLPTINSVVFRNNINLTGTQSGPGTTTVLANTGEANVRVNATLHVFFTATGGTPYFAEVLVGGNTVARIGNGITGGSSTGSATLTGFWFDRSIDVQLQVSGVGTSAELAIVGAEFINAN